MHEHSAHFFIRNGTVVESRFAGATAIEAHIDNGGGWVSIAQAAVNVKCSGKGGHYHELEECGVQSGPQWKKRLGRSLPGAKRTH
jgi:hypothetical protein